MTRPRSCMFLWMMCFTVHVSASCLSPDQPSALDPHRRLCPRLTRSLSRWCCTDREQRAKQTSPEWHGGALFLQPKHSSSPAACWGVKACLSACVVRPAVRRACLWAWGRGLAWRSPRCEAFQLFFLHHTLGLFCLAVSLLFQSAAEGFHSATHRALLVPSSYILWGLAVAVGTSHARTFSFWSVETDTPAGGRSDLFFLRALLSALFNV